MIPALLHLKLTLIALSFMIGSSVHALICVAPEKKVVSQKTSKTAQKPQTVIFVHGGAWVSGSAEQYRGLLQKWAQQNYCVCAVDYSLAPEATHPRPVNDLIQELGRLKTELPQTCDENQLHLVGHSAGAHLIFFWASQKSIPSSVRTLIGVEGIYDILALSKKWPAYKEQFLKLEFGEEKNWKQASPQTLSYGKLPSVIIFHSEKDELVDLSQSQQFYQKLIKEGHFASFMRAKEGSHFGVLDELFIKYPLL